MSEWEGGRGRKGVSERERQRERKGEGVEQVVVSDAIVPPFILSSPQTHIKGGQWTDNCVKSLYLSAVLSLSLSQTHMLTHLLTRSMLSVFHFSKILIFIS